MCRRAGAIGVTLGVIVSTTVELKQKNLLNLTPRSTDGSGRLNVQIESALPGLGTRI